MSSLRRCHNDLRCTASGVAKTGMSLGVAELILNPFVFLICWDRVVMGYIDIDITH